MTQGYSRTPRLLKGAIIQFQKMPLVATYNVIGFQYNPESFTRTITPYVPSQLQQAAQKLPDGTISQAVYSQPQEPTEQFSLSLILDASDELAEPLKHPVTFVSGVAGRLAALEMLQYKAGDSVLGGLVGTVTASIGAGFSKTKTPFVKRDEVPVILFVWGPGRILPVRLQSLAIEEQQWNQLLYPTRAKVTVGMKVVTKDELDKDITPNQDGKSLASFCYQWTRGQKEALAVASVTNVEGLLDFLPF
jgi:hypothetical protein